MQILAGLLTALDNLDAVITILRNSPDGTTAKAQFQTELDLNDAQADAILAMPMRRLTGMERKNLQTEFEELTTKINALNNLLIDRGELLKSLKKDLRSLKRKFADDRRTRITPIKPLPVEQTKAEKTNKADARSERLRQRSQTIQPSQLQIVEVEIGQPTTVELTHRGYIRRLSKTGTKLNPNSNDFVTTTYQLTSEDELTLVTTEGKAYPLKVKDIPPTLGNAEGTILRSLIPALQDEDNQEQIIYTLTSPPELEEDLHQFLLLTQQGKIKRILRQELTGLTNRGTTLIKLKEDDSLHTITPLTNQREIIIATSGARILRLALASEQIPLMGRVSQGIQALKVGNRERIVGCTPANSEDDIILLTRNGYAKSIPISTIRIVQTGNMGTHAMQFATKTDNLIHITLPAANTSIEILTTTNRQESIAIADIKSHGKDGIGDRVVNLSGDEEIMSVIS